MPSPNFNPHEDGIVPIARRIASVAEFIEHHYVNLQTKPLLHPFMSYLHHRLLNYEWLLLKNRRAFHEWENPLPKPGEAIEMMKWLQNFFHERAERGEGLDRVLGDDVGFVGALTERVMEGEEREEQDVLEANRLQARALRIFYEREEKPVRRPWRLTDRVAALGREELEGVCAGVDAEAIKMVNGDTNGAEEDRGTANSSEGGVQGLDGVDADTNDVEEDGVASKMNSASKPKLSKNDQRNTIADCSIPKHPPRRFSGRPWFVDDIKFADLVGEPHQWLDANGEHFIDATPLDISGLETLIFHHPIDEIVVKDMDWDVLRFVRLALWDWTNGYANRMEARASLGTVRRELARRKKGKGKLGEEDGAATDAASPQGAVVIPIDEERNLQSERIGMTNGMRKYATTLTRTGESKEPASTNSPANNDIPIQVNGTSSLIAIPPGEGVRSTQPLCDEESKEDDDTNTHVTPDLESTTSPTCLMSQTSVYNPTIPTFLPNPKAPEAAHKKPCCFERMRQKLRRKGKSQHQHKDDTSSKKQNQPSISQAVEESPWLDPLNTHHPKLRSSRGRQRIESQAPSKASNPLNDHDKSTMGSKFLLARNCERILRGESDVTSNARER